MRVSIFIPIILAFVAAMQVAAIEPVAPSPRPATTIAPPLAKLLSQSHGRAVRAWVFFTDKAAATEPQLGERLAARQAELSPRALRRRALRGIGGGAARYEDLSPSSDYIEQIRATGATLRQQSRWLNAISVEATREQVAAIGAMPFVRWIQPVAHAARRMPNLMTPLDERTGGIRDNGAGWYANSYQQLNQIGVVGAHNAGFTGAGVVIGILDTGFVRTHDCFNQATNGAHPVQVLGEYDFINHDGDTTQQPGDPPGQAFHGTSVLGLLGSYYPTVLVGGAFDASFLLAKTEDTSQEVPAEEDNYVAGLEWIEANGGDLATSSLGYINWYTQANLNGTTAVTTVAVNMATSNGLVCCTAAGNSGHDNNSTTSHLNAPADAFKVFTCGAVDSTGLIASFSSDGPTADGRVKPEVLADGVNTTTVTWSDNTSLSSFSGTSAATPLVAGGAALVIQAHPTWTVDKLRRAMLQTASDFQANSTYDPLYIRGYGIINVLATIQFVHGDINGDGLADGRDIAPFISAFLGTNADAGERRRADVDVSGTVDAADVPIFVSDLLGL